MSKTIDEINENINLNKLAINILESITDAFFSLDLEWKFIYVNNEAEKLLSRKREDLIGKSIWDEFPAAINSTFYLEYSRAMKEQKTLTFEEFFKPLDKWFSVRAFPTETSLSVYFQNINDKKLIEKEKERILEIEIKAKLEAETQQINMNNFFMQAPAAICILKGPEHTFEFNNPSFSQIFGQRELFGKTIREAFPELNGQGFYELMDKVYSSGEPFIGNEIRANIGRTGKDDVISGFFNFVYQPFRNADNKVEGIMIFGYEVTDLVLSRKKAEELAENLKAEQKNLQEKEERFRTLAEAIPQIVWASDETGFLNYYNSVWYEYTGKSFEETKGNGWKNIIHPEDIEHTNKIWGNAIKTGLPFEVKFRFLRNSDNTYRWFLNRGIPMKDEKDNVLRWVGTCTDIDEQVHSSQIQKLFADAGELLSSSIDYEKTLQNIAKMAVPNFADWVAVDLVKNNEIVRLAVAHQNPSKVELANEMVKKFPPNLDDPTGLPQVIRSGISEFVKELPDSVIENSLLDEESKQLFRDLSLNSYMIVPLKSDNQVIGGISFVNEKSSKTYTEKDLEIAEDLARRASLAIQNAHLYQKTKEMEESFRFLSEAIPQQVWTALPDGSLDYVNQRVCDYFSLSAEEIIGQGWQNVIHTDDLPITVNKWVTSLGSGNDYETEFRLIKPSENKYHWHIGRAISQKNENGEVLKWFGTNTNIHTLKEIEEKLARKSLELENSNNELQNFAYVASHDLQEPLRTMSSYAFLLQRRNKDNLDHDSIEFLELIIEASKRMKNLIEDLLEYSQIGKQEFKKVDLNETVDNIISNLKTIIEENNVSINYNNLPVISAIPSQMIQLFQNLITNSIKYRSENDPLIDITVIESANEWQFSISDNGIGINKDYFQKIFVIFQRLHSRSKYSGTGIGLATCKKIIDLHHGKIWLESEEDKGTTFFFTISKDAY